MQLYHIILKSFLNKERWEKYGQYLDYKFIKENQPELFKLYNVLEKLHQADRQEATVGDLELVFATEYPAFSAKEYSPIFRSLNECQYEVSEVESYLLKSKEQAAAARLARVSLSVAQGILPPEDLKAAIHQMESEDLYNAESNASGELDFVSSDLEVLLNNVQTKPGLRWPIASLNRNLGSIRKGDFGFLFARPETGKTTFLATVVPFMAAQGDGPVLWFNNEEQGDKVQLRCYQSVLGLTLPELLSNVGEYRSRYFKETGDRIKIVADASITKTRVEQLCQRFKPSLIIFDQIDKIHGFQEDRADLELKAIYVWARELAKQYAPVIAVCQAGMSGEGKRWLTMGDVDNSKTGKQGEADWILGIGKAQEEGLEAIRYLHLSKNKLTGDPDGDPGMRHGKWEVRIRPEIARYEDF